METRTLFMIGNGFDLAHGLRTSYMDFFHYLEELRISFYCTAVTHYFHANDIPQIINHPASVGITKILHLHDPELENVWCSYFEGVIKKKQNIETWIDFEKEIQSLIQQIEQDSINGKLWQQPATRLKILMNCNGAYENFPNKLKILISKIGTRDRDIDILVLMKNYREQLSLFLYDELCRYTFCFELYLACIMPTLPPNFPQHTSEPLSRFFSVKTTQNFLLSFNYTDTAEERYKMSSIQYIHGKLRSPDELMAHMLEPNFQLSTPLILGFHTDTPDFDTNPTPFLFFEKFFQRILHETTDSVYKWIDLSTGSRTFRTVIYGHSLDSSDGDFIKFIFEKSSSIIVYYHEPGVLPTLITNLVSIFGRKEVNRIHIQGKLTFLSADTLKIKEPEADYALT